MSKVTDVDAFALYSSIRLHYTQKSYDIRKYGLNRKKFNHASLQTRNDKYFYSKLSKVVDTTERLQLFLACNMFYVPNAWVGDMLEEKAKDRYLKARSYRNAILHNCLEDFKYLLNKYGSFIECVKTGKIVDEITSEGINPETYLILNRINKLDDVLDRHFNNIVWSTVKQRLVKYNAFLSLPSVEYLDNIKAALKQIIIDRQPAYN